MKKEQKLAIRGNVKAIFDSYALNPRAAGGSAVEQEAFVEMMQKHGELLSCTNFDPDKDMPELDEQGRVTFTKFEQCGVKLLCALYLLSLTAAQMRLRC